MRDLLTHMFSKNILVCVYDLVMFLQELSMISVRLTLNTLGIHITVRTKSAAIADREDVVTENAKESRVQGLQVLGLTPSPDHPVNITVDIVNMGNMDMAVIGLEETDLRTRNRLVSLLLYTEI